jgi:uncharacterized protein (TIGR03545 family)
MRPKGLIGLAVIILLVVGIAYLLSDRFIESHLESAGESIVGARVEIDNLNFSLAGLSISLDRLQVTNPNDTWKNMFETGKMAFDMEAAPLARKKVIINNITIADIRVGTKRVTDGALPPRPQEPPPEWMQKISANLKQKVDALPVLNVGMLKQQINIDSLMAFFDIQSVQRIEAFKFTIDSTQQYWRTAIAEFDPKNDLAQIETQINELRSTQISGVENLVSALDKSKRIYETLDAHKKNIEQKKNFAVQDFKGFANTIGSIDNWITDDFNAVKSKANLPDFSPQNIGNMLFGKNIVDQILNLLPYIDKVREYMPVAKKAQQLAGAGKVQNPPRLAGQDIDFPLREVKPKFLIEQILVSGATNQQDTSKVLRLAGQVNGITSQPPVYGKPLDFQLDARLPNANAYQLTGEIDHTTEIPAERFQFKASAIPMGSIQLPERPYLPARIDLQRADVTTRFSLVADQIDFQIGLEARPVSFAFAENLMRDDVISRVTSGVFNSIDLLNVSARVSGTPDNLDLHIGSNIDNLLAERMKGVLGESVKAARAEIEKRINAIVQPKKQEALALVSKFENQILGEINTIENSINSKLAFLDEKKKELEDRIKTEKEKGLKEAGKKLKDLIKN